MNLKQFIYLVAALLAATVVFLSIDYVLTNFYYYGNMGLS